MGRNNLIYRCSCVCLTVKKPQCCLNIMPAYGQMLNCTYSDIYQNLSLCFKYWFWCVFKWCFNIKMLVSLHFKCLWCWPDLSELWKCSSGWSSWLTEDFLEQTGCFCYSCVIQIQCADQIFLHLSGVITQKLVHHSFQTFAPMPFIWSIVTLQAPKCEFKPEIWSYCCFQAQ